MALKQERARRTRAAIVEAAAAEFGRSGYAAASVTNILEGSQATKGAMYFHFESKERLAAAVLAEGVEQATAVVDAWTQQKLGAFEILRGLLVEVALRFQTDDLMRAEFRLVLEPAILQGPDQMPSMVWARACRDLARRAATEKLIRPGADWTQFADTLVAVVTGQRYISVLTGSGGDMGERFLAAYEVLLESYAEKVWLDEHRRRGWEWEIDELPSSDAGLDATAIADTA